MAHAIVDAIYHCLQSTEDAEAHRGVVTLVLEGKLGAING